ncbi:Tetratricopeptide TPR-1 [Macleaya cordata]|uniref:Tetratricopeptide TPR-1 n=1 Tax=Macleaya cordata TaxID=56857 RepID=A0A200Q8A0_MACCD|nr:Tetratricopeptide TPR-1 [Macleaya cordata]
MEHSRSPAAMFLQSMDKAKIQMEYAPCPASAHFQFFNAAYTGKLHRFKKLASKHDDGRGLAKTINSIKDEDGRGALTFAAAGGKLNVCKYLIEELRLKVDVKDGNGITPLCHAAIRGHLSTVEYLLEKGANLDASNDTNHTPLHYAAKRGDKEILALLLSRGARVDVATRSGTALQFAAALGHHDAVKVLLDHHANPNVFFHHMLTPLVITILVNSLQCVELLIQAGADPNAGSSVLTPLVLAAGDGLTEITKCLLEAGADPNLTNNDGLKPVEIAAIHGHHQIVGMLFPLTSRIPTYVDWSIGGLMKHEHYKEAKKQRKLQVKEKFHEVKSRGTDAFRKKQYLMAAYWYAEAMELDPSEAAALLSNKSLCYAHLNDGLNALSDANECISLRPDWPKAYYRAGVALNILKRYNDAADAFFEGLKLDPENKELKDAFRDAIEARLKSIKVRPEDADEAN